MIENLDDRIEILRYNIKAIIDSLQVCRNQAPARELSLAITKLEEAEMWIERWQK